MSASGDPGEVMAANGFAGRIASLATAPRRILYLGASVTAQKVSYCHKLHETLRQITGQPHDFDRIAEGGGSSAFVLGTLLEALQHGRRFDLVFLETLTGDLNLLVTPAVVPALLGAAADAVRAQGGDLCVLKMPRMDRPADHPITLAYDESAAALGLPVLDMTAFGRPAAGAEQLIRLIMRDGVHTTDAGAALLGAAIASRLLSPDQVWPEARPAPEIGAPLRERLGRLRLHLDELVLEPTDGLRRESFVPPSGRAPYPVLVAPAGATIRFSFPGYVACLLFVSAPDTGMMTMDFHGVVRRSPLLDRYGYFPHLHMKPLFRDFRPTDVIAITALDELPDPNPVASEHRRLLSSERAVRFLGVLGAADADEGAVGQTTSL